MRKRLYILLLSLRLLLPMECSKEDEVSSSGKQPVTFSGTISEEVVTQPKMPGSNRKTGDAIGVYMKKAREGIEVTAGAISNWDKNDQGEQEEYKPLYAIGDFYPNEENPKGIVFWIDRNKTGGKVVSLAETSTSWGVKVDTKADHFDNGRVNMQAIKKLIDNEADQSWADFPAFEWIHLMNPPGTDYSNPYVKGIWYLPAERELEMIYEVWNRRKKDWETMMIESGYAPMKRYPYLSSSEKSLPHAWVVHFSGGIRYSKYKNNFTRVRAVLAF